MQIVSYTVFATIWRKFGYTFVAPSYCYPKERSLFGTMNMLALWWMDLGWGASILAVALGAFITYAFEVVFSCGGIIWLPSLASVRDAIESGLRITPSPFNLRDGLRIPVDTMLPHPYTLRLLP